jgi:hypothetical protein
LESKKKIPLNKEMISRKDAIVRVGKYSAFTAAAMMQVLVPMETSAAKKSPKPPRGSGGKK